ncbi:MAG: hypothetical protein KatS3mg053_2821 [Candidatus Roseilinea sp.]|nr:MAG: hypothetical protein KatS3mg053_2821 [Candidatus Roseilinea sp.]
MKTIGKKIESQQPGVVLGSLTDEAKETTAQKPARPSRRKQVTPAEPEERLSLPRGALVVMRKSGGLSFSSRTVTVRTDGRIVRSVEAGPESDAAGRQAASRKQPARLTKQQLSQLRITLAQSGLGQASERVGRGAQPPDAYAYEIVGRVGRKVQSAEVFDGSIPEAMQPLIRELNSYLG